MRVTVLKHAVFVCVLLDSVYVNIRFMRTVDVGHIHVSLTLHVIHNVVVPSSTVTSWYCLTGDKKWRIDSIGQFREKKGFVEISS